MREDCLKREVWWVVDRENLKMLHVRARALSAIIDRLAHISESWLSACLSRLADELKGCA